ncbi:hypothetical protein E1B28_012598 [Marasmius oreades]|uniref:Uncharacterized protein n=1 Tax=Marasmius oreades TaxID=181124 RepID=A0A9P7RQ49_9AGAR|nr:uncharacterized protein E1B28_013231 [Marasmius oreades]XP_043005096.1 uncharacterized protein E1B28_012598 [Marasmius oreades]KAG7087250.1 hypothetical protein E1B28_013231 [Marasmius oreades]KAG7088625.1 hypothetical protein E1B28_012598 [Marasmius oreades]
MTGSSGGAVAQEQGKECEFSGAGGDTIKRSQISSQIPSATKNLVPEDVQLRCEEWLGHLDSPEQHSASTGSRIIRKGELVAWAKEFRKRYPTRPHSPQTATEDL